MPNYFDIYKQRVAVKGTNVVESLANATKYIIKKEFKYSPFYKQGIINGESIDVRIVENEISTTTNEGKSDNQKQLLLLPDTVVKIGDIINIENENWLVIDFNNNEIFPEAKVNICHTSLKYLNEKGVIIQTYGFVSTKNISNDVSENRYIIVPDGYLKYVVQSNADTVKIIRDKRFLLNDSAWRVTFVDRITQQGLIYLTLKEEEINETNDNIQLGIADYYNNLHGYFIAILNGTTISLDTTQTLQINVQVLDNGFIMDNPSIVYSSSDTDIAIVSSSGLINCNAVGNCIITAMCNNVSDNIELNVVEILQHNYSVEIQGSTTCTISQQQVYNAIWKDNGNVIIDNAIEWWLTADNGIDATNLATITYLNNICTIKANNNAGYVRLYVKNANELQSYLRIQIKSLW